MKFVLVSSAMTLLFPPQDAQRNEHGRDLRGARIVVEWARGPGVSPPEISRIMSEFHRRVVSHNSAM